MNSQGKLVFWSLVVFLGVIFLVEKASSRRIKNNLLLDTNELTDLDSDDELLNQSTQDLLPRKTGKRPDPYSSWISFVRRSERANRRKKRKKNRKINRTLAGQPGPRGPQGPAGPAGPPGAEVTVDKLMTELRTIVREEAEERTKRILVEQCPGCESALNDTLLMLAFDGMAGIPRVSAAFHERLRRHTIISGRSFMELKNFYIPFGKGVFQRTSNFDTKHGRFTAPIKGVYDFSALIHVRYDGSELTSVKRGLKLRKSDNMKVLICILSQCRNNAALEAMSGLESNSKMFTLTVNGLLELEADDWVSVYVDNNSSESLTILSGSAFMGHLVAM